MKHWISDLLMRWRINRDRDSKAMCWAGKGSPELTRFQNPGPSSRIVLFDGVCNLCSGLVQFVIRRDPKENFSFISLQSDEGKALLKKHEVESLPDSFVYIRNGQSLMQSTAGIMILRDLGGAWKLARLLSLIPQPLRDSAYNFISKHRYRVFGKKTNCAFPTI